MNESIRESIKNREPVSSQGYSTFLIYECPECGNRQRFPFRNQLIHHIRCNACGHLDQLTFILGDK